MKHQIRIKKELFNNIPDIKAIIKIKTRSSEQFMESTTMDIDPDFQPVGLLDDNEAIDIGIVLETPAPGTIEAVKTAMKEVFEGKIVEVE